ncbi:type I-B CRISPR-associated protein Cas7/Cst2/DevR [Thermococcus argininiproducens]|uniref:Type I-B CRISPR-associated protein Cas7/Cst2/DevR n=1 Tax=Thermococcus argininiproducens TaxID=2866384 RepID=A0A9E7MB58_9EURY|nr:type I-B CRISPR-associated protein Cas7/Cst2/DevR [Thermococcus argininiproducens]USH00007.1 type I-B CRISPR-associated protein Cas7/Cst2/DevR [Thermococcus argininiproducens]
MRKIVIGLLTRVSGNVNANEVDGDRIRIKKLVSTSGEVYPFVSARAVKRGIREKLAEWGFEVDPFRIGEGNKLADSGDPIKYVDNDLFGYLYIKGNQQKPRQAPVSLSPVIAVEHTPIQIDFGGRFPKKVGSVNPTPFETEVADFIGLMKIVITERVGIFAENEKTDQVKKWDEYTKEGRITKQDNTYILPDEERIKRVSALLEILLNEGWAYPRRTNYFAMAEHISTIIYAGERLYPVWKASEEYQFKKELVPYQINEKKEFLETYELKKGLVPKKDIEKLATWLVSGVWKKG